MLLGPQLFQDVRDPAVDRSQPVQPGMAGPAKGDQGGREVRGPAVVDHKRGSCAAYPAEVVVAGQDLLAAAGEAGAVTVAAVVAGFAKAGVVELRVAAWAEQRELLLLTASHC